MSTPDLLDMRRAFELDGSAVGAAVGDPGFCSGRIALIDTILAERKQT